MASGSVQLQGSGEHICGQSSAGDQTDPLPQAQEHVRGTACGGGALAKTPVRQNS